MIGDDGWDHGGDDDDDRNHDLIVMKLSSSRASPKTHEKSCCIKDLPRKVMDHTLPPGTSKPFGYGSKLYTIILADETPFTSLFVV